MKWLPTFIAAAIGGILIAGIIFILVWRWEREFGRIDGSQEPRNYWRDFRNGILAVFGITVLVCMSTLVGPYARHGMNFALNLVGLRLIQLFVGLTVILIGGILYIFKHLNLKWYGRVEVIFAAATAIITARQITDQTNWLLVMATLGGCVYVVARGFSNTSEAKLKALIEQNKKRDKEIDRIQRRREWERTMRS